MALVTYIPPNTDAQLRITLKDRSDVAITSGTVTADVYNPSGTRVATASALTHLGAGVWALSIAASWSYSAGVYTQGEFVGVITASYSGNTLTKRVRWPVMFDDNT